MSAAVNMKSVLGTPALLALACSTNNSATPAAEQPWGEIVEGAQLRLTVVPESSPTGRPTQAGLPLRSLVVLLICVSSLAAAAQPAPDIRKIGGIGSVGAIEVVPGETVYFQLVRSVLDQRGALLDTPSPAAAMENPGRESLVVKATYEISDTGGKTLRVRNGYDHALNFRFSGSCMTMNMILGFGYVRPGAEVTLDIHNWDSNAVLCGFMLSDSRDPIIHGARIVADQAANRAAQLRAGYKATWLKTEDRGEEIVFFYRVLNPDVVESEAEITLAYNPSTGTIRTIPIRLG